MEDQTVRGTLYLASLLLAQAERLPLAPTLRGSLAVLDLLRHQGVIAVPWPEASWGLGAEADETPIEHLHWRPCWSGQDRAALLHELEAYLRSISVDEATASLRLELWNELVLAEAEHYFAQLLFKNRFDVAWTTDLAFVVRQTQPGLSRAQWRYCCWAAVRHGAATAHKHNADADDLSELREVVAAQLRRRADHLARGRWSGCTFPPDSLLPKSALGRVYTTQLAPLAEAFWSAVPTREALLHTTTFIHRVDTPHH